MKELKGFFHDFFYNVPRKYLSHPLRIYSKRTPQFVLNVSRGLLSKESQRALGVDQFYHKLSKKSLIIRMDTLKSNCGVLFKCILNEWLRILPGHILKEIMKESLDFFLKVFPAYCGELFQKETSM